MNKNYTEVIIGGKTFTLGGYEDPEYLQKVATYINTKISELKKTEGYNRQNSEYRNMLLLLNLADDYFKLRRKVESLEKQEESLEKEIYDLKQELLSQKNALDKANAIAKQAGSSYRSYGYGN